MGVEIVSEDIEFTRDIQREMEKCVEVAYKSKNKKPKLLLSTEEYNYSNNKHDLHKLFDELDIEPIKDEVESLFNYLTEKNLGIMRLCGNTYDYQNAFDNASRDEIDNDKWTFRGIDNKGNPKFIRYTNETLNDVISFLDKKDIKYIVKERALMLSVYSYADRYSYYYTTGSWDCNKKNNYTRRKKTYSSRGIKDFYTRFLKPTIDREKKHFKELYVNPRYIYDYKYRSFPHLHLYLYLLTLFSKKPTPFLNKNKIEYIQDEEQYKIYQTYRSKKNDNGTSKKHN